MDKLKNNIQLIAGIITISVLLALVFIIPNSFGSYIVSEAKAKGYMEYQPMEAHALANQICTQCHTLDRIKSYCPRCGPPFVAVVPHMQTFIENYKQTRPELKVVNITEPQAVAITQVWNALIGNWESDFREKDILKLIGHYSLLKKLYLTPVEERKIEKALAVQNELKIGHMSDLAEMQKNLGKPENNPPAPHEDEHKHEEEHKHDDNHKHDHEKHTEHKK